MHTFSVQALIKEELHFQSAGDTPDAFNFFTTASSQLASRSPRFIGAALSSCIVAFKAFGSSCEMVRAPNKGVRAGST